MRPEALVCTDIDADPVRMIGWYLLRWRVEGTFQEVRAHLGVETQRQWSDKAIARTTPLLLGLFSLVALVAGLLQRETQLMFARAHGMTSVNPLSSMPSPL